jgi:hypothetical protein
MADGQHATGGARPDLASCEFAWGAEAISKIIGQDRRATFRLLEFNRLPGVRKLGGRYMAHIPTLIAGLKSGGAS